MYATADFPLAGQRLSLAVLLLALLFAQPLRAELSTVSVPVRISYPLLQTQLESQLFDTPDGSREILNDPRNCNRIVLSRPGIRPSGEDLEITAHVAAELGVDMFGGCVELFNWQGDAVFLGRPMVQPDARSIKLEPQKTWLVAPDGSQLFSGRLWDAASARLMVFFGGFTIDLAAQLETLGALLPEVLPRSDAAQLQASMNSLQLSKLHVSGQSLDLAINFDVETTIEPALAAAALSADELQQFEQRWQMMDALLVAAVKHYAAHTGQQDLRSELLSILINSRYQLRDVLTLPPEGSNDAVRSWFIDSWQQLGQVAARILHGQQGPEPLLWFSAVTAGDALQALDRLGPSIGLAISTDGLRRLARLINAGQVDELLNYSEDIDPELQQLLRDDIDAALPDSSALQLNFSLFPMAYAEAPGPDLSQWLPVKGKLGTYLPRVQSLLKKTADETLQQHKLERGHQAIYGKLVLATAWQESCWRQFVVIARRIEPLRSSSGDTGLMQVNERVWRGFYDLQKLRWDIDYNIRAGSEILLDYLVRYALKRGEQKQPGGVANLARASYSAYNGGPGQVARYRSAKVAAPHKKVDELFWEKYLQVAAGKAMNVARCLGEELEARGA